MEKHILTSGEFINESVYCKLKTFHWYSLSNLFRRCAREITGYQEMLSDYYRKNGSFSFEWEYRRENGKDFDFFGFYGIKTEFVETDRGDKFVFSLDDTHSFIFYPMCDEKSAANAPRYDAATNTVTDPKYGHLVMYAYADGKSVKINKEFNHYYLCDNYLASKSNNVSENVISEMKKYVKEWGFDKKYEEISEKVLEIMDDIRIRHDEKRKRDLEEAQRIADEKNKKYKYMNKGCMMTVRFNGKEILRQQCNGHLSTANVRLAFTLNAKLSLEHAKSMKLHPDTSDMTNLDGMPRRKAVYTERNLPKDHYELVDYYRTHSGEFCEHCGKDPIVNVMVIRNPEGKTFHVGNECVSHLVDIPEEEFDENWNAPFKEAGNMMTKVRNDKNKGIEGTWYTYNNKCFYVIENTPMFDYDFFSTKYLSDRGISSRGYYDITDKVLKRDLSYKEKDADFMKRMLPRWYAESIEIPINIGDLIEMMYNGKKIDFTNFTYDGVHYSIPHYKGDYYLKEFRMFFIGEEDLSIGEYSQSFDDAFYGIKNAHYRFGNLTIDYEWERDAKIENPDI